MRINSIINYQKFGRALSTKELNQYQNLLKDAKKTLGIQDTEAIVFDFNVPSEQGFNTGIGTTFSNQTQPFVQFLKTMADINSIQVQPQGKINQFNTSPYSGTNFAIGEHIIDLKQLTTSDYAHILSVKDVQEADKLQPNKESREFQTDYEYVIGKNGTQGVQQRLLEKAYSNFESSLENNNSEAVALNTEFDEFKQENKAWLEKNALYEALIREYGTGDFKQWDETDKFLYSTKTPDETRNARISELNEKYSDVIEFENFKQFLADKQQKESKKSLNNQGIKLYGDCLIGFSYSEMWGDIDCFQDNLYYGGPDPNCPETNYIQTWGLPALDYTLLGECDDPNDLSKLGETGKLLFDKYKQFFKRYDGLRVDAAWQFSTPFIYKAENGNYEEVKQPEINYTIFNIIKAAANGSNNGVDNNGIMLELVGISAGRSREMTLNQYPHLYTTAYAEYDENPAKFLEKGYQQGMFYAGVGCHDNDSMINMAKDEQKRNNHTEGIKRNYDYSFDNLEFKTKEYQKQSQAEKTEENFRNAKFAEIFTSAKQFFTLPDFFGMKERINVSGKSDKNNWSVRIPLNFEKFYFENLSKGKGINIPKALANAMMMRHIDNPELISKCNEAAEILRSSGPMTTKEADLLEEQGKLNNSFEYSV